MSQLAEYHQHARRPIGFVVLGIFLLGAAGYLANDVIKRRSNTTPVSSAYSYTVKQSVDKSVTYFPSSFYDNGPGKNSAYIMDLTDKLKTTFHYSFSGSEEQKLSYAYDIRAIIRGRYSPKGSEADTVDVWTKEVQVKEPVHDSVTAKSLTFDPSADVSYDEYKRMIEQLRLSMTLPISSDITVLFTINVSGIIDGTPFNDIRTASVTAPIGEQIFILSQKYDKQDTKQIVTASIQTGVDRQSQYETYGALALGVLSLVSFVYGLRKQIFKTPYQRELEKIYRYHDGIIIRAAHQADLSKKSIVQVKSFEDMLNLEEELKSPIVSSPAGLDATRFTIIYSDVAYQYTLGKITPDNAKTLEEIQASLGDDLPMTSKREVPARPTRVHDSTIRRQ